MKHFILLLLTFFMCGSSLAQGYRNCAGWDTFCKSPPQIVATKCRLGVPVDHSQCDMLGVPSGFKVRGGGSMLPGLPATEVEDGVTTEEVLKEHGV